MQNEKYNHLLPTPCAGMEKGNVKWNEKSQGGGGTDCYGCGRNATDTGGRPGWERDPGMLPEHRWERFPTVSPIHRGNDGIPFPLDNLTISPARWRQESLKAYGNAIVPQVMYRIFQAIEEASK